MKYNTGKKQQIIAFLSSNASRSFTVDEICDAIIGSSKGRSTVYRLIAELLDEGCIRRISDEKTRHCTYQYIGGESCHSHLHLMCRGCGELIHLDEKLSHEFKKTLFDLGGFSVEEGCMIFGSCKSCHRAKEVLNG